MMRPTRRRFVGLCLTLLATLRLPRARAAQGAAPSASSREPQTLLVLGGTGFVGPHIVEAALKRGFKVTLFNRGKTNPNLFPQLEKLVGDRQSDLSALEGRKFDAVVDTSGILPGEVERSAALLAANIGHYVLVSTTAVYARLDQPGLDETAPLATLPAAASREQVTPETYGALRALGEQALETAMGNRAASLRCGILAGPGDPTDRFTYWPVRLARGGEVLAPDTPDAPTQLLDARDLADFALVAIERKLAGAYNVDAAGGALTIGRVLDACKRAAGPTAKLTFVPAEFLAAQKVEPLTDLPLWTPARDANAGFGRVGTGKAKAAGLKYRPLETTARDTLEWWRTQPEDRRNALRAGLPAEREAAMLAAWRAQQTQGKA